MCSCDFLRFNKFELQTLKFKQNKLPKYAHGFWAREMLQTAFNQSQWPLLQATILSDDKKPKRSLFSDVGACELSRNLTRNLVNIKNKKSVEGTLLGSNLTAELKVPTWSKLSFGLVSFANRKVIV